jgi:hypothetical protein
LQASGDLLIPEQGSQSGPAQRTRASRASNGYYLKGKPSKDYQQRTWRSQSEHEQPRLRGKAFGPMAYANAQDLQHGERKSKSQRQIPKTALDIFANRHAPASYRLGTGEATA